jgi:hypothetical protein
MEFVPLDDEHPKIEGTERIGLNEEYEENESLFNRLLNDGRISYGSGNNPHFIINIDEVEEDQNDIGKIEFNNNILDNKENNLFKLNYDIFFLLFDRLIITKLANINEKRNAKYLPLKKIIIPDFMKDLNFSFLGFRSILFFITSCKFLYKYFYFESKFWIDLGQRVGWYYFKELKPLNNETNLELVTSSTASNWFKEKVLQDYCRLQSSFFKTI